MPGFLLALSEVGWIATVLAALRLAVIATIVLEQGYPRGIAESFFGALDLGLLGLLVVAVAHGLAAILAPIWPRPPSC